MVGNWGRSLIQSFHGHRTVRYFDLLNAAPVFRTLPAHPAILPVVRAVLGPDCLLSTFGTVAIGPEEPAQAIHADDVLVPAAPSSSRHLLQRDGRTVRLHRGERCDADRPRAAILAR